MAPAEQFITGVDFVAVPTHDLEAAVEFYGTTLGLPCSVHMPERHFAEFETGNLTLNIMDAEAMGLEHHAQHNLALHVDDMEAARAGLEARGVDVPGRHVRHRRLPHGVLRRPGRERADAAPPVRAAGDAGVGAPRISPGRRRPRAPSSSRR